LADRDSRQVFFVNTNQAEILGNKVYAKIGDIAGEIDLAVVAVPAQFVLQVVSECCQRKVGGIIIVSSGFGEIGGNGKIMQDQILEMVRKAGIPMLGPNCLGIIRTENKLNVSFAPSTPKSGSAAFISQSGALLDVIIDGSEKMGMSYAISYGNEADITLTDLLEWIAGDSLTKVLALYVEAISDGQKFMEVAKKITKIKPIVAIKAGKFESAKNVVKSHTGSLAGDYQIYKTVFKQTGIIEADSIEELTDISKVLSWQPARNASHSDAGGPFCRNSFAIVTNGGGCGVMATDYCKTYGINLAKLSKETIDKISSSGEMSPNWSKSNPADIVGDALPGRYKVAIEAILSQKDVAGLMVIQTPQIMTSPLENAKIIVEAKKLFPEKPIVCFFLGGEMSSEAIKLLEENNVPNYSELKRGIVAIKALVK